MPICCMHNKSGTHRINTLGQINLLGWLGLNLCSDFLKVIGVEFVTWVIYSLSASHRHAGAPFVPLVDVYLPFPLAPQKGKYVEPASPDVGARAMGVRCHCQLPTRTAIAKRWYAVSISWGFHLVNVSNRKSLGVLFTRRCYTISLLT